MLVSCGQCIKSAHHLPFNHYLVIDGFDFQEPLTASQAQHLFDQVRFYDSGTPRKLTEEELEKTIQKLWGEKTSNSEIGVDHRGQLDTLERKDRTTRLYRSPTAIRWGLPYVSEFLSSRRIKLILPIIILTIVILLYYNSIPKNISQGVCTGSIVLRQYVKPDMDKQLTFYDNANSVGGILDNRIRAVAIDHRGVWFGYFPVDRPQINSIGFMNREVWELCNSSITIGKNTNDILSYYGEIWVATDGYGVITYDGSEWSTSPGLESLNTYVLTVDQVGTVVVGTLQGVSAHSNGQWNTRYATSQPKNNRIYANGVHAIAYHPSGQVWIGHISDGISRLNESGAWEHFSTDGLRNLEDSGTWEILEKAPDFYLRSNNIRGILVDHSNDVWIATDGGGVSRYRYGLGQWDTFTTDNSALVSDRVMGVVEDKYDRVWAYTDNGISYYFGGQWQTLLHDVHVLDLAFGPNCVDCNYNDQHVWLGTANKGIAHRQIPPETQVADILDIIHPNIVAAGEEFHPIVRVRVQPGYQLSHEDGDGLFFISNDEANLFGSHPIIPINRPETNHMVNSGDTYDFVFSFPSLRAPSSPGTYESRWCVWHDTQCASEEVVIRFTVADN